MIVNRQFHSRGGSAGHERPYYPYHLPRAAFCPACRGYFPVPGQAHAAFRAPFARPERELKRRHRRTIRERGFIPGGKDWFWEASVLHTEGRRFETSIAHHFLNVKSSHWRFPGTYLLSSVKHLSNILYDMGYHKTADNGLLW